MRTPAIFATVLTLASALTARANPVAPKSRAPEFTLNTQDGTPLALKDLRGRWVVLYFYPKDFTGGCTLEAHNFERDIAAYQKLNAVIVGVSTQDEKSHKEFCVKEGLSFKLLADTRGEVAKKYNADANLLVTVIAKRMTFLIDPDGVIARTYVDVDPGVHSAEVLRDLGALSLASAKAASPPKGAAPPPAG